MSDVRALAAETLRAAARTDPGRVRLNNEDLPLLDAARGIFGVIDGIGGQAGGEVAAATARDVILQRLARPLGTPSDRVREAIAIANNEIHRRAEESSELRGMACVITLALVADGWVTIGHVGDSRLYKIRPGGLRKLTRDHSPVGEREDAGELSEVDAMHHPRRNEVFRDVGSILRDKDEQDFVDVLHERMEPDSALLLCSDGLTDMLPSSSIAHIVRQHAGDPEGVVDALVAAANAAGGRDNVTVVYAEMPKFAEATGDGALAATEPLPDRVARTANSEARTAKSEERTASSEQRTASSEQRRANSEQRRAGRVRRFVRAVFRSRMTWFAIGTLIGVLGSLALILSMDRTDVRGPQTFVVGGSGATAFATIASAIAEAKTGDTVRVEPGTYRELIYLRDGIDLVARMPGSVTVLRPAGARPGMPSVMLAGERPLRVFGIRFEASADLPADVAIRVAAPATLELVDISGAVRQALAVSRGASLTLQGGRVSAAKVMAGADDSQATMVNNVFVRTVVSGAPPAAATEPAIAVSPTFRLTLTGNVFHGFADVLGAVPDARRKELLDDNIVVPPGRSRDGTR